MTEAAADSTVVHGSATTEQMIRWLEDTDQTIGADLRWQIAYRLRELRSIQVRHNGESVVVVVKP